MKNLSELIQKENFWLFGMGGRKKMIFCNNCLFELASGKLLYRFKGKEAIILPNEYKVVMEDALLYESESGVYLEREGMKESLIEDYVNIPDFKENPYKNVLKILFHDIVINIVAGKPVPNLMVYKKPWFRDAAMMCMVLEKTHNLHLVYDWILNLDEIYDKNNAGNCEPDNLGQVLYMISLVSDETHPLVPKILKEVKKWQVKNYIVGITDGKKHPVYQTKWLKFGLQKLGLEDNYQVPPLPDDYAELFWMDGTREEENKFERDYQSSDYPYLNVAKAHYYQMRYGELKKAGQGYPLTWERNASEADYKKCRPFLEEYYRNKICAPHTWHASELFLLLMEE